MRDGFFPPLAFDENERRNDFTVQWYSRYLEAMREPSLWALSEETSAHVYRFLWLRTFNPPIVVRLDMDSQGAGQWTVKMTDGKGGYETGRLVITHSVKLPPPFLSEFLGALDTASFWNLPTADDRFGLDGAQWILEGVKGGQYHIVDRWSPKEGPFREAALTLNRIGGLMVMEVY